jgi:hypothetical protein
MKQILSHNRYWQVERANTLSLGYCFSNITIDVQGKPYTKPEPYDDNWG